ncbi:NlpC/P60 family protein [Actinomadura parmotrematis]|uniref:C40 family peptidase n=1 Tax=Actinomadura parmotrematis TaxID=2864039 RepID=A0ABS7G5J2_9ACTN|nr:NlpC/P60 family protein [Actinomadura parmotrematis]MBW8487736.1 C40 family peptidase [Actinomadura parmotrematis]
MFPATNGRRAALRLVTLSSCTVVGLAALQVPGHTAKPAPTARDVDESRRDVRAKTADVGEVKAELAQADGELDRLAAKVEGAVERYNGEQVKLAAARADHADAVRRLAEAARKVDAAQADLATFAARAYADNTGYNPWAAMLSGRGGPQGFVDRAGLVQVLARRRADAITKVKASRTVADLFRRQAAGALAEQRAALGRAAEAKRAAESALAEQRAAVQRIEARKRQLEASLGAARAKAEALARARREALERAEAARLKQAAQQRAGRSSRAGAVAGLPAASGRGAMVVRAALRWLGTPYSWGGGTAGGPSFGVEHGSGIYGFDCSGLALYAWAKAGVRLDHWTGTQWTSGPHVPIGRLRPGDLVFFANDTGDPDTIHHVGIFIGGGRMVEAPFTGAQVRISTIYRNGLIGATRPGG